MNLLLSHMIGDYLFQNRWMALNKTKNTLICILHCLIYTLSVMFVCQWFVLWKLAIIFVSHFIMDRFRLAKYWRRFFSKDEELPWIITSDNTIHLFVLWILSLN